jgi:glycosyltransferase involved in cell wall biosynthesis
MKVLFISNLFPDATEPMRGIFNARSIKYLARLHEIRVVSPRPTRGFPPFWSPKTVRARPEDEFLAPVFPPVSYIPKFGSRWNHRLMARGLRDTVRAIRAEFPFDVVLGAWAYPDGCAVARLAAELDFPFVVVAQGSDVHQYLKIQVRRRLIIEAFNRAAGVVTQSRMLAQLLAEAGVAENKLHTIYNGVEAEVFQPGDRNAARAELNLPANETVLLYVGNFLPIKNPLLLVEAFAELVRRQPEQRFRLMMIGDGPLRPQLEQQIERSRLSGQVTLAGRKSPAEVTRHMQAADLLCVPSDNEGVPNVLLEAFSCGLRAVATRVGGVPEMLTEDFLGRLVERRNPVEMAQAISDVLALPVQTEKITAHAGKFSWEQTAAAYAALLESAVSSR